MLSVIINVKNGETYLHHCLNALFKFDDIILFDNYSDDNTIEIAKQYKNVRIFQQEFSGMGIVRNQAALHAKNDWVLFIDSDEIISQALVEKLLNFEFKLGFVYQLLRENYYANNRVNYAGWENDWVTRIYNKTETSYNLAHVHESVITDKLQISLINDGVIHHFPYHNVVGLVDKLQKYSSWYAIQNFGKKKVSCFTLILHTLGMFIKCYILKRGFLHGYEGLLISSLNTFGVFVKYSKLYELQHKQHIILVVGIIDNLLELQSSIELINRQKLLPNEVCLLISPKLCEMLNNNHRLIQLLVPYTYLSCINGNEKIILRSYMKDKEEFDKVIYCLSYQKLKNRNLIRSCKKIISGKYNGDGVQIFTKYELENNGFN